MTSEHTLGTIGPALYFRRFSEERIFLAALVVRPVHAAVPGIFIIGEREIPPQKIAELAGVSAWRYDFDLGQDDAGYEFENRFYPVETDLNGDLRVAFVSCNGEETGDLDRDQGERNAMWAQLCAEHEAYPFALMLQGGDQLYADEVTKGHPLTDFWPDFAPREAKTDELSELGDYLRERFVHRYLNVMSATEYAWILARVPTLSVWDDHDICDGWGSLKENRTYSGVGQTLFQAAREMYLLFQHAATEEDIPDIFWDPTGRNLGWTREIPGLTILAPDLRSERDRHQVMGPAGWQSLRNVKPAGNHTFLISSVPLLGPRLSLVEMAMMVVPRMQHYEDDLRDQWQSRSHRAEWCDMLRETLRLRETGPVTAISGEIHLATRAEMGDGAHRLHQLVASGISHPAPPKNYARGLGLLAGLGEAPLPEHPIRIKRIPGQKQRYVAERNFLVLERQKGDWQATWHLEDSGKSPPLPISE